MAASTVIVRERLIRQKLIVMGSHAVPMVAVELVEHVQTVKFVLPREFASALQVVPEKIAVPMVAVELVEPVQAGLLVLARELALA